MTAQPVQLLGRNASSYQPLRPETATLVLIDLQEAHLRGVATVPVAELRRNVVALAKVAALYELPAILTISRQPGPGAAFLPEIPPLLPGHALMERTAINAFDAPEFVAALKATGRRQLLIAGIATEIGVLLPALSALSAGYEVAAIVDACGGGSERAEQAALLRLNAVGVALTSWFAAAMEMQRDSADPRFPRLMAISAETAKLHKNPLIEEKNSEKK